MSAVNVYFLAAVVAVIGGVFAVIQYIGAQHRKAIERIVEEVLENKIDDDVRKIVEDAVHLGVGPLDTRLSVIETKMDVFWKSVAVDMAQVLHHPVPSRHRVDELLDKFKHDVQAEPRTMSEAELAELKDYLCTIRDWEPGSKAPFKIFDGEQGFASILLRTMDHALGRQSE